MRWIKRCVLLLVLLGVLAAAAVAVLPWKQALEGRLRAAIEAQGLAPAQFTLATLAPGTVVVRDAALGTPAVTFARLTIDYPVREALAFARQGGQGTLAGHWRIEGLSYHTETLVLPPLAGAGEWAIAGGQLTLSGTLDDAAKSHHARFALTYPLATPEAATLTVHAARMPWGGGVVSLTQVAIPLSGKTPITFRLGVRKVALAVLLKALAGDVSSATGVVSGEIPVTYHLAEGTLTLGKGTLKADAPGIITLAPEVIPGDNPQVGLVREVMKNLHYEVLSLTLAMDGNRMLSAGLTVEGRNPEAAGGRAVKLQVNLSGDLLNLLLDNVKLMNDPTQFIEQNSHENASH